MRNPSAMLLRIIHSNPARLAFVICAVVVAVLIIHYRILVMGDNRLLRANPRNLI